DLVNWKLIGYALKRQPPFEHFAKPQHGNGVWAPSIRYHKGEFYIYYPDPDFGIYLTKAASINGPWSEPLLVQAGKGLIDPCPLWDDNGKVYLVHAFAGSRAGIKSILVIKELNAAGTKVVDDGVLVYDGHETDPTIEGPKLYKRNGYYYIFAPAGGVATGWQLVLRAKNIYGPYERKVVMDQGTTSINGPHQGAWVTTTKGEDWFIHFQDKEAYGRVVHLQPLEWKLDWPVIGADKDGDGKGEPVLQYKKPNVGRSFPVVTPPDSDEFNERAIGLQWQWHANPELTWAYANPSKGVLRLFSEKLPDHSKNLWDVPNLLLQKFPAEAFSATAKIAFHPRLEGEQFGLLIMGSSYAYLSIVKKTDGNYIVFATCKNADKGSQETSQVIQKINENVVYLRIKVHPVGKTDSLQAASPQQHKAICNFEFSADGKTFKSAGDPFVALPGRWIGSKAGFFFTRNTTTNDAGYADVDWFRVEK
ncbi:MAG TPA: family 43 glycosylhydrolase, partial [Chitinophagaceae bacterium]